MTAGGEAEESLGCNYTITHTEGEKDGRLCLFVGFDLAWPVLDSHLGRESRNTQPQISGTETSKQRQQFLQILEQETFKQKKRESSPSLFILKWLYAYKYSV